MTGRAVPGRGRTRASRRWPGWAPDTAPVPRPSRCTRPVAVYETAGAAVPEKYGTGAAIRQARKAMGMSQRQLAEAVGVSSRKVIATWEHGRKYPRKGTAELERVLGITLDGPVCDRPAGHNGPCRSATAVARYRRDDLARWQDRGRRQRQARRDASRRAA